MFAKPYKQKSNNTLKNTEKKHLVQRIKHDFAGVSEEKIKELVPNKSSTSCMKLVLHSEETVGVYVVDGVPMFIETGDKLVPTVCALWKVPTLVPTLIIQTEVLHKVQGGAPLYAPGVVVPGGGAGGFLPALRPRGPLACCSVDNAAAALVGIALLSSGDLLMRQGGVVMETVHFVGDQLCRDAKFNRIDRPTLGRAKYDAAEDLASDVKQLSIHPPREEWPSLGRPARPPAPPAAPSVPAAPTAPVQNEPRLIKENQENNNTTQADDTLDDSEINVSESPPTDEAGVPPDMDGLLRWCLLSFIKLHAKTVKLPLKTNLLYRNYLMPLCPPGRTLDVKKSTYKKMSKFMEAMQQEGLLEVRELEHGVDGVTKVTIQHEALRGHRVDPGTIGAGAGGGAPGAPRGDTPPQFRDVVCVTAAVTHIMPHRKGTAMTSAEVRACVTQYIKIHNLTSAERGGLIAVDAGLAPVTGKKQGELIRWEELMNAVHHKMTASTEVVFADGRRELVRARLPPVTIAVASRAGNKKVTLVSNLEQFGFVLARLCSEWQAAAAAACCVTRSPGARADQLLLQGDQTYTVAKLLIEKYGLPKKYLEGADKALSKKNK